MPTSQQLQAIAATTKDAQDLLSSYMQLKQTGEPLPDQGQELLDTLDTLYDLHSSMYAATRDSKQETANAKAAMDEKHIGLQNVMYEKRHLLEEIVKCRAFRSLYQDVELVPIEEFHARAPQEYLENQDNPHQLMINRLKFEQLERTSLRDEQEKLQAERLALIRENRKAQEKLDRFDEDCIKPWLKVNGTCPVCRHSVSPEKKDQPENSQSSDGNSGDNTHSATGNASASNDQQGNNNRSTFQQTMMENMRRMYFPTAAGWTARPASESPHNNNQPSSSNNNNNNNSNTPQNQPSSDSTHNNDNMDLDLD